MAIESSPMELKLARLRYIKGVLNCSVKEAVFAYRFLRDKPHIIKGLGLVAMHASLVGGLMLWLS